jgi:hypothetical protein
MSTVSLNLPTTPMISTKNHQANTNCRANTWYITW